MGGLLWLLAVVGVLGTASDLAALKAYLISADASLPLTSPASSKICYHFDLSQTCAGEAIGHLLAQPAVADVSIWTATEAVCDALLEEQRFYAESVASSVFGPAIASAATASLADFELLVQSWVLRVGHHKLSQTHTAFVDALNAISDWTTVKCDGTNFLYGTATMTKPDFLVTEDCTILGALYPATPVDCTNSSCSITDSATCCQQGNGMNSCCSANYVELSNSCANPSCGYKSYCCSRGATFTCCTT